MYVIGLTGGIACGKSTIVSTLQNFDNCRVLNADLLGHQTYASSTSKAFQEIVEAFGDEVVQKSPSDGSLSIDRKALGARVFGNPEQLKKLTDIVYPAIKELAEIEIEKIKQKECEQQDKKETIVILEAAVLIEAGW